MWDSSSTDYSLHIEKADLGIGKQVNVCKKNKILKKSYYEN